MAAQPGSQFLLKRGDGGGPENFTTVGGFRTNGLALNKESVDITDKDSVGRWRELLAGGGGKSTSVSGAGVFKDSVEEGNVRADFFGDVQSNYQVIVPDFGTFEGPFEITRLDYAGEHNHEVTWNLSLESAGEITFTAA